MIRTFHPLIPAEGIIYPDNLDLAAREEDWIRRKVYYNAQTWITKTRPRDEKAYHSLDMIDNALGWNTAVLLEQFSCLDGQVLDVRIIP